MLDLCWQVDAWPKIIPALCVRLRHSKKVVAAAGSSRLVNLEHFTSEQTSATQTNYLLEDGVYCTNTLLMECCSSLEGVYQTLQLKGHSSDLRAQNEIGRASCRERVF